MARYTFEMRELVDTFGREEVKSWFKDYELSDYLTPEEINVIEARGTWDKDKLAERIITHFYLREIGQEAPGAFILYAKDLMKELMETYAPLIYSASIKFDPLVNVNYTVTTDRDTSGTGTTNTTKNGSNTGLTINSDTPQGEINKTDILNGRYASSTSANEGEANETGTSQSQDTGSEHSVVKTLGNSGVTATAQAMVQQYRDIIRAINTEIVYNLEPLFMAIY